MQTVADHWWEPITKGVQAWWDTSEDFLSDTESMFGKYFTWGPVPTATHLVLPVIYSGSGNYSQLDDWALEFAAKYVGGGQLPTTPDILRQGGWYDMTTLVIPNVYEVAVSATNGSRPNVNVFHVMGGSSGQQASVANTVAAHWLTVGASGVSLRFAPDLVGQQVKVTDLSTVDGGIATAALSSSGSGTAAASQQAAALVTYSANTRSRSSHGRMYLGGLASDAINDDGATITSAAQADIESWFGDLTGALSDAGFQFGVASRTLATFYAMNAYSVDATLATQRRRVRG